MASTARGDLVALARKHGYGLVRSSRFSRSGSAITPIAVILSLLIVKPITANGRQFGAMIAPAVPLTSAGTMYG